MQIQNIISNIIRVNGLKTGDSMLTIGGQQIPNSEIIDDFSFVIFL